MYREKIVEMFITLQINQHPNITEKIVKMFITLQINVQILSSSYTLIWILFHRYSYDVEETWLKSIPHKKDSKDPAGISKVEG